MLINFYSQEDENIANVDWPFVPRRDEYIYLMGKGWVVCGVCWGTCVDGNAQPILNNPCVSIKLKRISVKK